MPIFRIEIHRQQNHGSQGLKSPISVAGVPLPQLAAIHDVYFLEGNLDQSHIQKIAESLIIDPVIEHYTYRQIIEEQNKAQVFNRIEITLKPGVTDNTANQLMKVAHQIGITELATAKTGKSYEFSHSLDVTSAHKIAKQFLVNDTVQCYAFGEIYPEFIHAQPGSTQAQLIMIRELDDGSLMALSNQRRLALNLKEMQAIQMYYRSLGVEATDAELETLAQTWSEHCGHKTFKAEINIQHSGERINSLLKTYLQAATEKINAPWVHSAFIDNAGVIAFDDAYDLSFKVETHNHPSAIEPFGGANTGVGGVVRDILGVSHRPIATTDVLCFGPQDLASDQLPDGVLHPLRIKAGVVDGVGDYGNKLGLPTVNGSIYYHPGYTANPLVYCGCVGIGPRDCHPRSIKAGDRVIVLGGRTGRDGIRGATFSSQAMDTGTSEIAGASVQIGDPITEKGLLEVVERARDAQLYTAITDCGAGGLSSAVGEMSADFGTRVDLAKVPLKYPGLSPWEIWLSEAQERVVMAVPQSNLPALQTLCDLYWVELSDIGEFIESGRLQVVFGDERIVDLDNAFLHKGIPSLILEGDLDPSAVIQLPQLNDNAAKTGSETEMLLALLSHPNITSKEHVIRRYDHEVRGSTVIKPLTGQYMDGPSDAAVLKPSNTSGWKGFSLANGINPYLGEVDAYSMALSVIDEAIRNAVAVGTDPQQIALLDNFCWGNPNYPDILGSLIQAAQGCYNAALHYGTPFISGKDSLYNEYIDETGQRQAIPGTLLISSIGIVPDIRKAITMDLKTGDDLLYLVGEWQGALAGSHAAMVDAAFFGENPALCQSLVLPPNAPDIYRRLHKAISNSLVQSVHDLSEGGLAVALAEMALAGRKGATIDISQLNANARLGSFGESNGCFLVEVSPSHQKVFEAVLAGHQILLLGQVLNEPQVNIRHDGKAVVSVNVDTLVKAFTQQEVRL